MRIIIIPLLTCLIFHRFTINSQVEQRTIDTARPILIFDLHGVLAHVHGPTAFRSALRFLMQRPYLLLQTCSPWFWYGLYRALRTVEPHIPELLFQELARYVPEIQEAYAGFLHFFNSYQVDMRMVRYIQELRRHGYRVMMASNIGADQWHEFIQERGAVLPELFELVFTSKRDTVWCKKSNPWYYTDLMGQLNVPTGSPGVIFIDDQRRNVLQCERMGYPAILFKGVDDLSKELAQHGVLVGVPPIE